MKFEFHADGIFLSWEDIFYKSYRVDNQLNTKSF